MTRIAIVALLAAAAACSSATTDYCPRPNDPPRAGCTCAPADLGGPSQLAICGTPDAHYDPTLCDCAGDP